MADVASGSALVQSLCGHLETGMGRAWAPCPPVIDSCEFGFSHSDSQKNLQFHPCSYQVTKSLLLTSPCLPTNHLESWKLTKTSSPTSFLLFSQTQETEQVSLATGSLGEPLAIPSKWRVLGSTLSMVRITPELSPYSVLQCCPGYSPLQLYQRSFLKEQHWCFPSPVLNSLKLILNQRVVSKQCLHNGFLQTHNLPNKSSFPESH